MFNKKSLLFKDEENLEDENSFQSSSSSSEESNKREGDIKDKSSDQTQKSNLVLKDNFIKNISILYELCNDPNMKEIFSKIVDYFIHLENKRELKMLKSASELESPSQTSENRSTMSSILSGLRFSAKENPKTYLDLFYDATRIFKINEISREMKLLSYLLWDRYEQDFQEIGLIGKGGFGKVYRVLHKLDSQEYAIKKINICKFPLSESELATLEEVKLLSQMNHPNVAKYYNSWIQYSFEPIVESTDEQYQMSFASQGVEISSASSHSIIFQNSEKESQNNDSQNSLSNYSTKVMSKSEKYAVNTSSNFIPSVETYESSDNSKVFKENKDSKSSQSESCSQRNERNNERSLLPFQSHKIVTPRHLMLFIQMELGKENLCDWIQNRNAILCDNKSKLDNAQIKNHFRIFREMSLAVEYIHSKGIIHRDIKPANILITFEERILLADFGLAKMCYDKNKSKKGTDLGTAPYEAPEIKLQFYNNKVDIYSLGIVLFELIEPFSTFTEREKAITALKNRKQFDKPVTKFKNLNKLLLRMTEKDPELRPSASEIVIELSEIGKLLDPPTSKCICKDAPVLSTNNCITDDINVASNVSLPSLDSDKLFITQRSSIVDRYLSKNKVPIFKNKYLRTKYKKKKIIYFLNKKFENKLEEKNLKIEKMQSKINELELRVEKLEKKFQNFDQ